MSTSVDIKFLKGPEKHSMFDQLDCGESYSGTKGLMFSAGGMPLHQRDMDHLDAKQRLLRTLSWINSGHLTDCVTQS